MRVTVKLYYPNQYVEMLDVDNDSFVSWIKDKKKPIHCFVSQNGKETYLFKDKILFAEVMAKKN